MAAVATLTKGPLGVVLAGGGFIAAFWERKTGERLPFKGNQILGIGLFLLITLGWFLLAYYSTGKPFIDKIIGKELVGHVVSDGKYHIPGSLIYQPPFYYLTRGAPWSLFGIYGLWRVWRTPGSETSGRRFERFLFCWFLFGLILFSLAPHQRGDLLWPIMPAGSLLAGRELDRLSRFATRVFDVAISAVVALMVSGFVYYYFGPHAQSSIVRQTVALKHVAAEIMRYGGSQFPLTHVDSPMGLQIYLNTWRPRVSPGQAAELLRGPEPVFIAVNNLKKLQAVSKPDDPATYTVVPSIDNTNYPVRIVSNRQVLESTNSFAFGFGYLTVRASGVRLADATEREFVFDQGPGSSEITIVNESTEPRRVRLRVRSEGRPHREERLLAGHEIWKTKFFGK
jgi:4-amino-4-deoxy-L-arabinose transferase-like glycosyltransferase